MYDENRSVRQSSVVSRQSSVVSRQSSDKDKRRRGARVLHALAACRSLLTLAVVLAAAAPAWAQTGWIIETVAGNGDVADGGAATAAQLSYPTSVAVDSDDNIYIADVNNHRIRKVDTTGNISTVAGDGASGYGGDGGPATAAQINAPRGVAVDSAGNIYIADTNNQRIRKVTASTGVITTVAGNGTKGRGGDGAQATAAQLNSPWDVAVDGDGNVYIADRLNARFRKVTASTGVITTVAGGGTGSYSDGAQATATQIGIPTGVAVDSAGNIYAAIQANRVYKVDATAATLSRVAAAETLRFPFGVAVDSSDNIYITDTFNNRILKVDTSMTPWTVSTVAGSGTLGDSGDGGAATSANMYYPQGGVAVDSSGNIYIGDSFNGRVRKVDSSGNISTFAGRLKSSPSGDGGAATSAQLNIPYGVAVGRFRQSVPLRCPQQSRPQGDCFHGRHYHGGGHRRARRRRGRSRGDVGPTQHPLWRGGGRLEQHLHRRWEEQPHPQGDCFHGLHLHCGGNHSGLRRGRRLGDGDGGEAQRPPRRGGGQRRQSLHRRYQQQPHPQGGHCGEYHHSGGNRD